jgi:phosphatidylserine/phosphatidylglycerophosphate/cardiolipin synthase-like enzyme
MVCNTQGVVMAELLSTAGCSSEIEKLIKNAKDKLFLITPYLKISPLLRVQLEQLDNRVSTITIKIVGRTDEIKVDEIAFLQKLKNVQILALENLHAKCYMNEEVAVITSLNLYQFSQQNNVEMGIKVEKAKDPELYDEIFKEVNIIIGQSKKYDIKIIEKTATPAPKEPVKSQTSTQSLKKGICIRSGREIDYNIEKPLCNTCYQSWAKYGDYSYPEKYCLICGKESKQSYEKPVCYSCYKKNLK